MTNVTELRVAKRKASRKLSSPRPLRLRPGMRTSPTSQLWAMAYMTAALSPYTPEKSAEIINAILVDAGDPPADPTRLAQMIRYEAMVYHTAEARVLEPKLEAELAAEKAEIVRQEQLAKRHATRQSRV